MDWKDGFGYAVMANSLLPGAQAAVTAIGDELQALAFHRDLLGLLGDALPSDRVRVLDRRIEDPLLSTFSVLPAGAGVIVRLDGAPTVEGVALVLTDLTLPFAGAVPPARLQVRCDGTLVDLHPPEPFGHAVLARLDVPRKVTELHPQPVVSPGTPPAALNVARVIVLGH